MPVPDTPQEIFENMPRYFRPEKAGDARLTLQFDLSGENGGTWTLTIAEGQCQTWPGPAENPDLTLNMTSTDFVSLIKGQLNAVQAVMTGKIRFKGNITQAMNLMNWFEY